MMPAFACSICTSVFDETVKKCERCGHDGLVPFREGTGKAGRVTLVFDKKED